MQPAFKAASGPELRGYRALEIFDNLRAASDELAEELARREHIEDPRRLQVDIYAKHGVLYFLAQTEWQRANPWEDLDASFFPPSGQTEKLWGLFVRGHAREDLIQEGRCALFHAWWQYDSRRPEPFRPFAAKCIRHAILVLIRRATASKRDPGRLPLSMDKEIDTDQAKGVPGDTMTRHDLIPDPSSPDPFGAMVVAPRCASCRTSSPSLSAMCSPKLSRDSVPRRLQPT